MDCESPEPAPPRLETIETAPKLLYRLGLRTFPNPEIRTGEDWGLDLNLISENGLYRRGDHDDALPVTAELLAHPTLNGAVAGPDDSPLPVLAMATGQVGGPHGRGKLCLRVDPRPSRLGGSTRVRQVFCKVSLVHPDPYIVPLVFGPLILVESPEAARPDTRDALIRLFRPFPVPGRAGPSQDILIEELLDFGIPGKIWDSAISTVAFLQTAWIRPPHTRRLLDLSSGTGLLGLVVATLLAQDATPFHVDISDLPSALPLIEANVALNAHLVPSTGTGTLDVIGLPWGPKLGNLQHLEPWNVVLCSDLIYEPGLIPPLLRTLDWATRPDSTVILGYKGRGLTPAEERVMWDGMARLGFSKEPRAFQSQRAAVDANLGVTVDVWRRHART